MDLTKADEIIEQYEVAPRSLIAVLQDVQDEWQYLPRDVLEHVAGRLEVPISQVFRVVTFYSAFTLQPRGRHLVSICTGTACHVRGSGILLERVGSLLDIGAGETTEDKRFSLEAVHCIGCCALAPAVRIDDKIYGRVAMRQLEGMLEEHE